MKRAKTLYLLGLLLPLAAAGAGNKPEIELSFETGYGFDAPVKMLQSEKTTVVKPHLGGKVLDKEKLLVSGLAGKGLHIGGREGQGHDALIFYRKEGLVPAGEGSVSFWVRPDDWDFTSSKNICFVRLMAPSGESLAVVSQMTGGKNRIVFSCGVVNKPGGSSVRATPEKSWKKGVWHHVAATWGNGKMTVYLDGKPAASGDFKPAAKDFNNLSLGSVWGHWSPGNSTLDDVRIFHRKLNDREVEEEFGRRAGALVSARHCIELKLGRRTAVVDGRIEPGEYASGFAFMRLRGKNIEPVLSDRQTTVFLSGDAENLYWGAVSAGENLKTVVKNRDGNVWEDDSLEFYVTSGRDNAPMHHFIVNSADAVYDAVIARGSEDPRWNCRGLRVKSLKQGKLWCFEAAIPWKEIGISPDEGKSFLFNACRTFVGVKAVDKNYAYDRNASTAVWSAVSPGPYADRRFYARAVFAAAAPAFVYTPFENVYKRNIDSQVNVTAASSAPDTVTLTARIDGKPKFHVEQSQNIPAGKTASFSLKGEVAREGILKTSLVSKNHGPLFAAEIPYFKSSPLLYHSLFTRLDKNQLVLVTECRDSGGQKCGVSLRLTEWDSGREVFKARQTVTTVRGRNHTAFDITSLPEGLFRVHYELSDASGKVFAKDTEYYVNYRGNPPWHGTQVGAEDVVPVPWTAPVFGKDSFSCWGRSHRFGGEGVLSSLRSAGKELLSRPVRLVLDGKDVKFTAERVKAGKGFAEYLLTPADGKLPLKILARAEFDGFIWFDLVLDKGFVVNSLFLEVPLDRRHVIAVDDNSSANVKYDITSWTSRSYSKNPVFDPFWWIGGESSGVMGGVESCIDWHFKHKGRGLVYAVTPKEVTVTFNFVDTPFTLDRERRIGFYLQGTPVKPKDRAAAALRDRKTMWGWSGYYTDFYEHKWPGMMYTDRYNLMHGIQKRGSRIFWYNSSKGASPVSPWWNRYGIDWNLAGDPGRAQQDMTVATRTLRDRNLWAWTCLNSRSFMEYKLYTINWFLNCKDYECRDLYFDLAWPRCCSNAYHGCLRRDEFGYTHRRFDLRNLREFHKRIYIAMKKKDPTALMLGHETFYRVPSDSFFDIIGGGETFERQIAQTHNYYDILTPEVMRILFGLRSNEAKVSMSCQIVRTMQMYSPQLYRKLDAVSPSIMEKEHRHFYAYSGTHNISNSIFSTRNDVLGPILGDVYESLGLDRRFHAYWDGSSGISPFVRNERFIFGAHSGSGRLFVIVLNDTDKEMTNGVVIDPAVVPVPGVEGKDIFSGEKFRMENNRLTFRLPPRESRFILFDGK